MAFYTKEPATSPNSGLKLAIKDVQSTQFMQTTLRVAA